MQNTDSKNILLSVIGVAILLVAVVGITYAVFIFTGKGKINNTLSTGKISMLYNESDNVISIENALPMADSVGKIQNQYFDFSVSANVKGKAAIDYEIRARRTDYSDANRLSDDQVNIYLEKKTAGSYVQVMAPQSFRVSQTSLNNTYVNKDTMLLYKDTINSNKEVSVEDKFRLRIWVKDTATPNNALMTYKLKVDVYSNLKK